VISLLDVNVLVSLFDAAHVHHELAHDWMSRHRRGGWATCPLTQNGCVRILSQPRYPGALPMPEVAARLRRAVDAKDHTFLPDDISLCDPARFRLKGILTARSITDLYLLAVATRHEGRLVTFDRTVPLDAALGASERNLLVL
jgi:toxin-antitoxin system PIN domain toxin